MRYSHGLRSSRSNGVNPRPTPFTDTVAPGGSLVTPSVPVVGAGTAAASITTRYTNWPIESDSVSLEASHVIRLPAPGLTPSPTSSLTARARA